jgi:nitroreductase
LNPVIDAIKNRRSVKNVNKEQIPDQQLIKDVLEAATWAPNHYMTEPWRFVVIAKDERMRLGESMAEALRTKMKTDDARAEEVLKLEREKTLRSPVIVALISSQMVGEKIVPQEEMVAVGAALQNMLLAAHSLGLGAMVKTGSHSYLQPVRAYFGLQENESLVGLVYLGYPIESPGVSKRSPLEGKVEWRGF